MKHLTEKIEQQQEHLLQLKDSLVEATKALEAAPDEEELLVQVEQLSEDVEKATNTLNAYKKAEAAMAERAVQQKRTGPGVIVDANRKRDPQKPGDVLFKHAVVDFLKFVTKKTADEIIEERFKDYAWVKPTYDLVQRRKSQVDPAMTTVSGWAEELVREDVRGFIDSLKDVSVAAALAQYSTRVDFGGANSVRIPRRNPLGASLTEPAWVAEGSPIPLTQFSFGSETLNRYKLAAITTFTREIAERSTPSIQGLLQDALREAYAEVLDAALLSKAAAVTNVRPAGLLAAPLAAITATTGGGEDAVRGDVVKLLEAHVGNRLGAKPVLILNNMDRLAASMMTSALGEYAFRSELSSGMLLGIPIIASANVPQHTAVMIDAAYFATAFDAPEFDVSDVATVVEASADDTPPTMASTAAGAAGTEGQVGPTDGIPVNQEGRPLGAADAGFKARSLWQTYSVGIRMVAPTSWGALRQNVVQFMDATTWTS